MGTTCPGFSANRENIRPGGWIRAVVSFILLLVLLSLVIGVLEV